MKVGNSQPFTSFFPSYSDIRKVGSRFLGFFSPFFIFTRSHFTSRLSTDLSAEQEPPRKPSSKQTYCTKQPNHHQTASSDTQTVEEAEKEEKNRYEKPILSNCNEIPQQSPCRIAFRPAWHHHLLLLPLSCVLYFFSPICPSYFSSSTK